MAHLFFTSADINGLVLLNLSLTNIVKSVILVCTEWNTNYRRHVYDPRNPHLPLKALHGLTISLNREQRKTTELVLSQLDVNSLRYLRLGGTVNIPPLPHVECLDMDFKHLVLDYEDYNLTHFNSDYYPCLRQLIIRYPETFKIRGLTKLETLTLYPRTFNVSDVYLKNIRGEYTKVVFHGYIREYNSVLDHVDTVEIHSPCNRLAFHCTRGIKRIVIDINPHMPHDHQWFEMHPGNIELTGDVSGLEELTLIGDNVVLPDCQEFKRLRVLRVSPNLHNRLNRQFPFLKVIRNKTVKKMCSECNTQIKHPQTCGQCRRVYYCNRQCQTKHWPKHKLTCKRK